MQSLNQFKESRDFTKSSAAILAPGQSLVRDIYNLPPADITIGLNHHSLILKPDWVIALDKHTKELLKHYQGLLFAKHDECDVNIGICPSFGFTGAAAVWLADQLEFGQVYLAGFDCYLENLRSYWHDSTAVKRPHLQTSYNQQMIIWETVKASLKDPKRFQAFPGFLTKFFKEVNVW
jgi:hypothetical protein